MKHLFPYLLLVIFISCQSTGREKENKLPDEVKQISDDVRLLYVPDKRVAVFDMDYELNGKQLMIKGETTSLPAAESLINKLSDAGYEITDSIRLLPDADKLDNKIYGIVNLSVCNLHAEPDFASEMQTQAIMGMPVRVLDHGTWYRIQTPDNYIAWVHYAGIVPVNREEYNNWLEAEKVIVTAHYGFAYEKPDKFSQPVSDVVAGNRFKVGGKEKGYYSITYPDGREAWLHESIAQRESEWRTTVRQDAASILQTAFTLKGVPYLWAGTSSKGMDCSGFVRNVLFMHDIIIPRDASQQAYAGTRIEIDEDFGNLQPGDLIFFGRKAINGNKERIVHVAIYISNRRFIHSQGDVRTGSFNKDDEDFDEFNLNRLLFATRILDKVGTTGINTTETNPYYQPQ